MKCRCLNLQTMLAIYNINIMAHLPEPYFYRINAEPGAAEINRVPTDEPILGGIRGY